MHNGRYYEYFNGTVAPGTLPPLQDIVSLPDFDAAARGYMNASEYTYYRAGVGGEWSYRNNLDSFMRVPFRPRMLRNATRLRSTMPTTALGYNFSAPFFIAPAARAGYLHPSERLCAGKLEATR